MSANRMAAVLRIRKLQERRARGELAMRRVDHRTAEHAERRTWELLDARLAAAAAAATRLQPAGPVSLRGERAVVDAGVLGAARQHLETAQAAERVAVAMDEWTVAARRVEGLERLSERLDALAREEEQRLAANEIDDLVLARFGREGSGVEP